VVVVVLAQFGQSVDEVPLVEQQHGLTPQVEQTEVAHVEQGEQMEQGEHAEQGEHVEQELQEVTGW
jgi:hypothetical protein